MELELHYGISSLSQIAIAEQLKTQGFRFKPSDLRITPESVVKDAISDLNIMWMNDFITDRERLKILERIQKYIIKNIEPIK